jgi:hypothetical protein
LLFATAALSATTAYAGNGDVFMTPDECLANLSTAQPYEPALVSSRARISKPMNGWKAIGGSGRACALEKTGIKSFRGTSRAPDAPWAQGFWVVIDRSEVVVDSKGQLADLRCFNPIHKIVWPQQENANVEQSAPRPVAQTRSTFVAYRQGQVAQAPYQPVPIYLPQQSISIPYFGGNSVAVAFGGNSTNTTNYYQGPSQQPPVNTPPFGGVTNPPAVQPPFGGVTNPPNTNLPTPLPGPVFNGNTGGGNNGVPGPVFNGSTNTGVPNPVSNGNGFIYGGVPAPNYGGGNNGAFNGSTGNGNSFGGFTAAPLPAPVFGVGNNGNSFGGSTGAGGSTFTPIPAPIRNPS